MISLLTGKILELGDRYAIIDVHGVGYKVFSTDDTVRRFSIGADTTFFTHLSVREDSQDLYGFSNKKERDFFELLITISGIGPKSALNVLSLVSVDALVSSIRTGSVAHLVKVSGIGRKTAEKIVLELKDKLGSIESYGKTELSTDMSSDMDAVLALQSLGYDADEAREALKIVSTTHGKSGGKELDTGAKIKSALKELGKP